MQSLGVLGCGLRLFGEDCSAVAGEKADLTVHARLMFEIGIGPTSQDAPSQATPAGFVRPGPVSCNHLGFRRFMGVVKGLERSGITRNLPEALGGMSDGETLAGQTISGGLRWAS
jgi:hypothetical protein